MRMMLRFSLPIEKGNEAFADGSLGSTLEKMMTDLKPEAAYFGPVNGKRGGTVVFDMADVSQIPVTLEPLFRNNRSVSHGLHIPMTKADPTLVCSCAGRVKVLSRKGGTRRLTVRRTHDC